MTTRRHYKDRVYQTHLLRRSYREGSKVKNETLANLSHLPAELIEVIRRSLRGEAFVAAGEDFEILRSRPHGAVAAVWEMCRSLGLPELLGPACPERDVAVALVVARVIRPGSKLATTRWWSDTTLGPDLGMEGISTDQVYQAMDWLRGRQEKIEAALARRHLSPGGLVLYDLSSSYLEGSCCPLARRGYSRDGRRHKAQINYGLMTEEEGRPISLEVFEGNTADPIAFSRAVEVVRERFGVGEVVVVGD
ncbi:MAG: IS1634 family transposase, partial [Acidimicrobiia bacterium]